MTGWIIDSWPERKRGQPGIPVTSGFTPEGASQLKIDGRQVITAVECKDKQNWDEHLCIIQAPQENLSVVKKKSLN